MKRIFALFFVVFLLLAPLAGCKAPDENPQDNTGGELGGAGESPDAGNPEGDPNYGEIPGIEIGPLNPGGEVKPSTPTGVFKYTLLEDESGYEVSRGSFNILTDEIVIPDSYLGLPVKRIADYGFSTAVKKSEFDIIRPSPYSDLGGNTVTTKLVLPSNLESIGYAAFECMRGLETVTIPDSVVSLGDDAFIGCTSLKKVVLPKSLKEIGAGCFEFCAINELALPEGLEIIGSSAFASVNYSTTGSASYSKQSITEVVIPESVREIGREAFVGCTELEKIILMSEPEYLGEGAFDETAWYAAQPDGVVYFESILYGYKGEMPENTSIRVPDSVKFIVHHAFYEEERLKAIYLPDGMRFYTLHSESGSLEFFNCTSLSEVRLPSDLTALPARAFAGCSALTEINLPDSLVSIGRGAFSGCSSITSIILPEGLTEVGDKVFNGCSSLRSVIFPKQKIETLGAGILSGVPIEEFVVPEWMTVIPNGFLSGCKELKTVTLHDGITAIEGNAFSGCVALASIELPDGISEIENSTFSGCAALKEIALPEGVTAIGTSAFRNCASLTKLSIPTTVTAIGDTAFYGCAGLAKIALPAGLKEIGAYAFQNCTGISEIILPKALTSIDLNPFTGCEALESIYYEGSAEEFELLIYKWQKDFFVNEPFANATIYYYSKGTPTEEGSFWQYDIYGKPVIVEFRPLPS